MKTFGILPAQVTPLVNGSMAGLGIMREHGIFASPSRIVRDESGVVRDVRIVELLVRNHDVLNTCEPADENADVL